MSRQKLLAYPFIDTLEYREKIDPYKLNLILKSIEESVLRAILRGSELNDMLTRLNLGVETSYVALSRQAGTLFSYANLPPSGAYATAFGSANTENGGNQDIVAGVLTLGWDNDRKYTKVPRYDTNGDGIPDEVSPSVSVDIDGTRRVEGDPVYNMLNRRNDSFWVEQVSAGDHTIQINLPPSLNKLFNYIELAPFPVFGVQITEVAYQDSASVWNTVYDSTINKYRFYNGSGPLVMHLSPKETNGVFRIKCMVDSSIGAIGFSNVDFGLIDYRDELQTAYLKFENAPTAIINLQSIETDFYVDSNKPKNTFITEMSIVNSLDGSGDSVPITDFTSSYTFGNESIDATNGLWLKLVMKESNRTSPVIRGSKLNYGV